MKNNSDEVAYWWTRIQSCKLTNSFNSSDILRIYMRNLDKDKIHKTIAKNIATYSIYNNNVAEADYTQDILEFISSINDNDVKKQFI